jgi:hypothetical protein
MPAARGAEFDQSKCGRCLIYGVEAARTAALSMACGDLHGRN